MLHSDWLIPQWPAPRAVRALCTTRSSGQSVGPYASLNLGDHVGDQALAVESNREHLQQVLAARPVFLSQVHGTAVIELRRDTLDASVADACYTEEHGLACTIMMADCLPILLTDLDGSFVAAAHAGWRGLAGQAGRGVIESLLESMFEQLAREKTGANQFDPAAILVWLGPCIGATAFVVGPEVKAAFVDQHSAAEDCFQPWSRDKWQADLVGLARLRLQALGVSQIYGNDATQSWCTASNPSKFFSHRRDRISGRMAACIWLD